MPKHYKEMMDEIINKMDENMEEDAPTNSAGGGNIAGIGVGPDGEPGIKPKAANRYKKKNKKDQERFDRKLSKMISANEDNNNVILKQINDSLDKMEMKIDEDIYGKTEIKIEEKKEYKTFKDKYNV
jgi:hypothetical protein